MKVLQSNLETKNTDPVDAQTALARSNRYKYLNSHSIINAFKSQGFEHVGTSYAKPRKLERQGFQKHILIFERPDLTIDDGNSLRLLAVNSHDGTSSFVLNLGVFRLVCANGLVVGDSFFNCRIPHKGTDFFSRVGQSIEQAVSIAPGVVDSVKRMQDISLSLGQVKDFKNFCFELRVTKEGAKLLPETLNPVRTEDLSHDLYTVFNRFQERVIRGGIGYTYTDDQGVTRRRRTSALKGIDKQMELNKKMWDFAQGLTGQAA